MEVTPIVPLLQVSGCLLGSVQSGLHDRRAGQLVRYLLSETERLRPHAVILDFSVIPLIDSFLARVLFDTAQACRLLGSYLIICGLPDAVIISMVELGIVVPFGTATRDVDTALEVVHERYRKVGSANP